MATGKHKHGSLATVLVLIALLCPVLLVTACQDLDNADATSTTVATESVGTVDTTGPTDVTETTSPASETTEPDSPEPTTETTEEATESTVFINIDDTHLRWDGIWKTSLNSNDTEGTSSVTSTDGSYVEMEFVGTAVSLVCRTGPTMGNVRVTAHGPDLMPVDELVTLYSSSNEYRQVVWSLDPLPTEGLYTVRVEYEKPFGLTLTTLSPTKYVRSIYVDGFEITGHIVGL